MEVPLSPISEPSKRGGWQLWKIIIGSCSVLILALCAYVLTSPCQNIVPIYDSDQVKSDEAREAWVGFERVYAHPSISSPVRPVRVLSISGRQINVLVSNARKGYFDPEYGRIWQDVFVRHHKVAPDACVLIRYSSDSRSKTEECCLPQI